MLPFVELPQRLARVMQGQPESDDARLVGLVDATLGETIFAPPGRRMTTMDRYLELQERIWNELGERPDPEAFRAYLTRLSRLAEGAADSLVIGGDGRWIQLPDRTPVDLGRRTAPRRILLALARARLGGDAAPVPLQTLVNVGWPGEDILPEAAINRLHVALTTSCLPPP